MNLTTFILANQASLLVTALFGVLPIAHGAPTIINFDGVANGTVINTLYPGVTFSNPSGYNGDFNIYARSGSGFAPSSPNVVSVLASGIPSFDARQGGVQAVFTTPVKVVSIDARPVGPLEFVGSLTKRPFLQAWDTANNFLGVVYYTGALPTGCCFEVGPTETLTITSTTNNIARVQFSSQFPGDPPTVPVTYGLFDNLQFDTLYTLTANVVGGGSVSASPSQATYSSGSVVTLTATPALNWTFSGWSGDGSGTANPLQLTMNGNKTVTANFVPVPPSISKPEATFCADFNSGVPAGMTLFGDAQVNGGFLKLYTVSQSSGYGIAYINDFNGGQNVSAFRATFKAALFGATCCGGGAFPADGFSFNLVPAATVLPSPGYNAPGEEGLPDGLAVNFDTWDNDSGEAPAIEVKWLGQIIASVPFQASQSPYGIGDPVAASRDVVINLDTDGTIDVSYGGTLVLSNVQTPYRGSTIGAPKWVLGTRVGLANDNHWIDDLCITTLAGGKLCTDFQSGIPAGTTLFGNANVDNGYLKLYTIPQAGGFGIAHIDDFSGGKFVQAFRATFKASLFGSTAFNGLLPADGFSFNLVPAATVLPNPGYNQPGEEGLEQGLAVCFDTWDNEDGELAPVIEIKWLGQVIASTPFQASQSPAGITDPVTASRDVVIELKSNGRMDVSYGGTIIFNNVATPYDPSAIRAPKWVLGTRVGFANDNYWFDDLCIATAPAPGRQIPGLFNTGVNPLGVPLTDNAVDPHYRLMPGEAATFAATAAGGYPIPPWLGSNSTSAWIAPATDTLAPGDPSGNFNYHYETTFDLTGFNPATARLAGRWATDNLGVDILINGLSTGQMNNNPFTVLTPFEITSGFVAGINRLTFVVNNGGAGFPAAIEPTGLRAEVWGEALLNSTFVAADPRLTIAPQNGKVALEWHQPGFVLQYNQNLTGNWFDLTRGHSVNGRDHVSLQSPVGPSRFFRLRRDNE